MGTVHWRRVGSMDGGNTWDFSWDLRILLGLDIDDEILMNLLRMILVL